MESIGGAARSCWYGGDCAEYCGEGSGGEVASGCMVRSKSWYPTSSKSGKSDICDGGALSLEMVMTEVASRPVVWETIEVSGLSGDTCIGWSGCFAFLRRKSYGSKVTGL